MFRPRNQPAQTTRGLACRRCRNRFTLGTRATTLRSTPGFLAGRPAVKRRWQVDRMIAALFHDRYRPALGSRLWAKYWAKRTLLFGRLISAELATRRYSRRCAAFGKRTFVSPSKIEGKLDRLRIGDDCAIGIV